MKNKHDTFFHSNVVMSLMNDGDRAVAGIGREGGEVGEIGHLPQWGGCQSPQIWTFCHKSGKWVISSLNCPFL